MEAELRELSEKVATLGRGLSLERGRSLAEGGALRAMEVAVGVAKLRVGGACRARDRAWERLRLQQEAVQRLWAELEAARAAREGAELRAREAESRRREGERRLERLRKEVAAANEALGGVKRELQEMAAKLAPPPAPTVKKKNLDP